MAWSLGIHGGVNTSTRIRVPTPKNWLHDAAAVLCHDGEIVAAAEEERFVRIKHVNYLPVEAIRFCLHAAGIRLADVDFLGLSSRHMEEFHHLVNDWEMGTRSSFEADYRSYVHAKLSEAFGDFDQSRLQYVGHHLSHTLSAVCMSDFAHCLCIVLDGWGDELTGTVSEVRDGQLETLKEYSNPGPAALYLKCTQLLGYDQFDEYKVMGLAPYGDPERFRSLFEDSVKLLPNGEFNIKQVDVSNIDGLPRAPGEPFLELHKDFAAALQVATQRVLFHVARHFRNETGVSALCLAGGVAQNCTANGKLLNSRLFERVFVQPVAYDAGCALGAALYGQLEVTPEIRTSGVAPLQHLYYGTDIGDDEALADLLCTWTEVVNVRKLARPSEEAARILADGRVLGWVQGKAEFGARALGNRSILADPRPRENMHRINAMVKKREGYRPFAPSVLQEYLHEYFVVPNDLVDLPYMVFVVEVEPKHRGLLGAITHVDGSARVQTVSRKTNLAYWELIEHFRALTGVPMVLNTSFNNHAEPIVNDCRDVLNCFVSTGLDALIIGSYLVEKRPNAVSRTFEHMAPSLNPRFLLGTTGTDGQIIDRHTSKTRLLSRRLFELLSSTLAARQPVVGAGKNDELSALEIDELTDLWESRVLWF